MKLLGLLFGRRAHEAPTASEAVLGVDCIGVYGVPCPTSAKLDRSNKSLFWTTRCYSCQEQTKFKSPPAGYVGFHPHACIGVDDVPCGRQIVDEYDWMKRCWSCYNVYNSRR